MIFGPKGKLQERANHLNPGEQSFADLADAGPGAKGLYTLSLVSAKPTID